jgi:hypothetical protein
MFFADKIASPDFSGMTMEERLQAQAKATTYFAAQRVARSALAPTPIPSQAEVATQTVITLAMNLPANGTPAYAPEQAAY